MLDHIPLGYYVFAGLLNFITSFALAIFVFSKNSKSHINQRFSLFAFTVAGWGLCYFLWLSTEKSYLAEVYLRTLMLFVIFIPTTFTHFILTLLKADLDRRINLANYLTSSLLGFTVYTQLFAHDIGPFLVFPYWLKPRLLFYLHTIHFFANVIYSHYLMLRALKHYGGGFRNQVLYVLMGTALGYSAGALNYLTWSRIPIPPFLNPLVSVYVATVAYAIIRHRLMDIEIVIKKTLVFAGLFGMVMVIVTSVTALLQNFLGQFLSMIPTLSVGLSGLIIILLYEPAKSWLVGITDRFLFQKGYSYDEIEDEIASCSEITDLNELCGRIAEIFLEKMPLETAGLFLFEKDEGIFKTAASIGASALPEKVPAAKSPFDLIFKMQGKVFRTGDLQNLPEGLKSIELVVKISYQEELIALLLLGKKKSDKDYSNDDIRFFEIASKHIANVINIARIFHFQRDFYALQAEKNRGDMLAQLSSGLDHEIKNPLNQSMPRMQMIMSEAKKALERGADERLLHKIIDLAETAYRHDERIVAIMSRLRRFSRPIPERERIELKPLNLLTSIREAVGLISERRLRDDSVTIECGAPGDLYVLADETLLVQTLYNVINNAYHAINRHGTITIEASIINPSRVRVSIQDTGHGIKPEHRAKIFEPFFTTKPTNPQGDDAHRFRGTGLGLGLVKRYMEECGGSISFETEVGKGTTFYLEFGHAGPLLKRSSSAETQNIAKTG